MTLTTAIEAAENAARDELASITRDMEALAENAKNLRDATDRLTKIRDDGARVERIIRNAAEQLRGPEAREPRGESETVDTEHLERVREARGDVVSIQTRGTG